MNIFRGFDKFYRTPGSFPAYQFFRLYRFYRFRNLHKEAESGTLTIIQMATAQ